MIVPTITVQKLIYFDSPHQRNLFVFSQGNDGLKTLILELWILKYMWTDNFKTTFLFERSE